MGGPAEDNIMILPLEKFAGVRVGCKSWSVNSPFLGNLYMGGVTDIHRHARRHQDRGRHGYLYTSLICPEMYGGLICTFIHIRGVGWSSQDGL